MQKKKKSFAFQLLMTLPQNYFLLYHIYCYSETGLRITRFYEEKVKMPRSQKQLTFLFILFHSPQKFTLKEREIEREAFIPLLCPRLVQHFSLELTKEFKQANHKKDL